MSQTGAKIESIPHVSQLPLKKSNFWTDRTPVLNYIKNEDKRFQTFVANRDNSDVSQRRYIPISQNPANDASRIEGQNSGQPEMD